MSGRRTHGMDEPSHHKFRLGVLAADAAHALAAFRHSQGVGHCRCCCFFDPAIDRSVHSSNRLKWPAGQLETVDPTHVGAIQPPHLGQEWRGRPGLAPKWMADRDEKITGRPTQPTCWQGCFPDQLKLTGSTGNSSESVLRKALLIHQLGRTKISLLAHGVGGIEHGPSVRDTQAPVEEPMVISVPVSLEALITALVQTRWPDRLCWRPEPERSAMDKLESLEELFAGPTLRPRGHHSVRALVPSVQTEPARPGGDDGRAWPVAGTYDHHAMGAALHAGVREALAPICPCSWSVVACRRDIRQDQRRVVLPLSCR